MVNFGCADPKNDILGMSQKDHTGGVLVENICNFRERESGKKLRKEDKITLMRGRSWIRNIPTSLSTPRAEQGDYIRGVYQLGRDWNKFRCRTFAVCGF